MYTSITRRYGMAMLMAIMIACSISTAANAQSTEAKQIAKAEKRAAKKNAKKERKASAKAAAEEAAKQIPDDEKSVLTFYGSGNIQKALEGEEELPASTGLGTSYSHIFSKDDPSGLKASFYSLEFDASINVASTVDTLEAEYYPDGSVSNANNFGSSILTPLNSGQAVKLSLRMDFKTPLLWNCFFDGIKIKYTASNRNWLLKPDPSLEDTRLFQTTNNSFRTGLFHEFLPKHYLKDYSINVGLYFAYNSVKGDIGLKGNGALRESVLGTRKRNFIGPEVSMEIKLKNLRAEFGYSFLGAGREVPGLTSGRLVTTISFVGGFPLKLDTRRGRRPGNSDNDNDAPPANDGENNQR